MFIYQIQPIAMIQLLSIWVYCQIKDAVPLKISVV